MQPFAILPNAAMLNSLARDLVDLFKFLTKDKSTLSRLQFSQTNATYMNTHSMAKYIKQELVGKLIRNTFSINIDDKHN